MHSEPLIGLQITESTNIQDISTYYIATVLIRLGGQISAVRIYDLKVPFVCDVRKSSANIHYISSKHRVPVVQRVVSLTSSLRVISLTVLADSIHNILIFFAEKNVSSFCIAKATHIFSAKTFSIFAYHSM